MDAQQLAAKLRDDIKELREKQNINNIDSEKLIQYLDSLAKDGNLKLNIEKDLEVNRQFFLKNIEHKQQWGIEHFRTILSTAENALKTAFLMNGGATVALLAFIGQLTVINKSKVHDFADSLCFFVFGVFLIVCASGFTYLAQYAYGEDNKKAGDQLRRIVIICSISSYIAFITGAINAYFNFKHF